MDTLKPQRNGPLYSNTVISTLAVDGWLLYLFHLLQYHRFSDEGSGRAVAPSLLLAVPNVTAHPSTASVPTSYYLYSIWHCNYICILKG